VKFRKRPVIIEAMQFDGTFESYQSIVREFGFMPEQDGCMSGVINIATLEGTMVARPGDWIIKGVKGEFYPCKPDIFEATYEAVEEAHP
jgi:hypothetical protein